jgi:uncharacterized damage-inducible protein DinB
VTALTADELLAWVDQTANVWRAFLTEHPEALELQCDISGGRVVADLVQHIVDAELGYASRLCSATYVRDAPPIRTADTLYALHERAMAMLRILISDERFDWEELVEFAPRSAPAFRASRRTVLVHLLMHSIRHHAQLATVVRHGGVQADWALDYLFTARR